jgi:ABC transport system ATP-binding/permease protein
MRSAYCTGATSAPFLQGMPRIGADEAFKFCVNMATPLLFLQNIGLTLGGAPLLDGADLAVGPRERLCVVGRNGSGKSTLLRIAAGEIDADSGQRFQQPQTSLRYLPQEPSLEGFADALAYVEAGLGPRDDPYRARYLLEKLGLQGDEAPSRLSGGEARRVALARVLAPQPDILLLDEPTNHLDIAAIEWLQSELASMRSALVLISHDRRFLQDLTTSTVWLDRGRTHRAEQGFAQFEGWRDQILEEEELQRHKLDRKIAAEEDWVRYGVTGRRKRNVRRMAELAELRKDKREARKTTGDVKLAAAEARASGSLVVEAEGLSKSFGDRTVVRDFSIRVTRKERIGVLGANGAGKTTLLKLLTGALEPDSGFARLGANVEIATLDQGRSGLRPDMTLSDALTGGGGDWIEIGGKRKHVVGYMRDFLFGPEQARTPVSRLSGGERARLALARALSLPSNFLVLDEPTNDLDVETLDLLQEMLADYAGPVLVVSHDRDFVDRLATSVVVSESDGRWTEYAGGYSDMVAQRGYGVGSEPIAARQRPRGANPQRTVAAAPAAKRRLSFKEKHALESLPKQIGELETRKIKLQNELADPGLYSRDPERFHKIMDAFARAQANLAAAEDAWLALELLREKLEG